MRSEAGAVIARSDSSALLASLARADWPVAARTFGSSHATLIGLIGRWWIALDPQNTVFDGAPSYDKRGQCDLLLCSGGLPTGVVEVEGTKPLTKLATIQSYFTSGRQELRGLRFGMLICYSYFVKGRGVARQYEAAENDQVIETAVKASRETTADILLVFAQKTVQIGLPAVHRISDYYAGPITRVNGVLARNGGLESRTDLWSAVGLHGATNSQP